MRFRPAALLIVVVLLAGVQPGAQAHHDNASRWELARWRAALSTARFSGVVSSLHYIRAEDGSQLSLTLHLPSSLPAGERVPTLLQITPYQADSALFSFPSTPTLSTAWSNFVRRGAAYVEADARGTTGSDGCLDFGGSLDRSDARTFAAWIRNQPWSNGTIVTDGISHPGMGSIVGHAAIPGLTAALAHAPVISYYQDEWLQGAKFEDQLNGPWYQQTELSPPFRTTPEAVRSQAASCTGQTMVDFSDVRGPFTAKWADRDLSRHAPEERIPVLLTHGFVDTNVHPDHSQLYWDALPDDYPKYAIFGWWYHGWPDMRDHPFTRFEWVRHRWLDATLFGRENGLRHEPRVLVEDDTGTWHEGDDWPLEPSEWVTFFPGGAGALGTSAPQERDVSYTDALGAERGSWEDASVVFRTGPLDQPKLINGAPELHLTASSSEPSTKWVAYLIEEAPDGSWDRVTHGYADSHSWGKESEWLPMEPNKDYDWDINLMPTAVVVEEGHRLVLVIASQDSSYSGDACFSDHRGGCYGPSGILPAETAGRAVNTVRLGPDATRLRIAWVDPAATQKPPW